MAYADDRWPVATRCRRSRRTFSGRGPSARSRRTNWLRSIGRSASRSGSEPKSGGSSGALVDPDELDDAPPRVAARIPVLLVALVEERVRGSLIRHEFVRHLGGVERHPERIHRVSRDRLIRAAEEAEHLASVRAGELDRWIDVILAPALREAVEADHAVEALLPGSLVEGLPAAEAEPHRVQARRCRLGPQTLHRGGDVTGDAIGRGLSYVRH